MDQLGIIYIDPAKLRPDVRNTRTHPPRQIKQLEASIKEFGFVSPIIADEDLVVIAGHGRRTASVNLGLATVPVIVVKGLSEQQKRKLRIADNKIALNAGWDTDLLRSELQAIFLEEPTFNIETIGFAPGELDVVLAPPKDPDDDDAVPGVPERPTTIEGDIWLLGDSHRLGCGDCRDPAFMAQLLGSAPIDAAFLDPPYNVRIAGFAVGRGTHREFPVASGELSSPEFRAFLVEGLGACARAAKPGAVQFVCCDHRHLEDFLAACEAVYSSRLNICVWNKSNAGMGSLYRSKHEFVLVMKVGDAPHFNAVELGKHGRNRTNIWEYSSVNSFKGSRKDELALHPTTKPVQMVADAIQDVTRRGETVLDAFSGSGTTLIACERTGRRFVGLDLDAGYVDVAIERWQALTGQEARHEGSGSSYSELRHLMAPIRRKRDG